MGVGLPIEMLRWTVRAPGGMAGLDAAAVPVPHPGPHDVVVRTRAVALNHRDLLEVESPRAPEDPGIVPCSDAAGEIVAVGDEVRSVREGDLVMSTYFPAWRDGPYRSAYARTGGATPPTGVLAAHWRTSADGVVAIPATLTPEQACTLPCAALTAWHALFEEQPMTTPATVLTIGTGGVSVFALQFARWAGSRVIAATRSASKVDRLRALGADEVVLSATPTELRAEVLRLEPSGVDHVVDVAGQGVLGHTLRMVRSGGTVSLVGALADVAPVVLAPLFLRNIRVQGIAVGSRAMLGRMITAYERGIPPPVIDATFAHDRVADAFDYFRQGVHLGKIVVRFPPPPNT